MKIHLIKSRCDYCHGKNFTKLFSGKDLLNNLPGIFDVVRCVKCSLVCTNPRPSKQQMSFYYPETTPYFQHKTTIKKTGWRKFIYYLTLDLYFNYQFYIQNTVIAGALRILLFPYLFYPRLLLKSYGIPSWIPNGRLLDIGCSYGNYLVEMKELGWNVRGIDLDWKSVNYGKTELGLDIVYCDFDSYETKDKFDVISARMFLEHMFSPQKVLEKAKKMLKTNGQMIIIIPDFSGFESRLYKNYAYTLQLPTHLFHFTHTSIEKYLTRLKYSKIIKYHHHIDRDLLAPICYLKKNNIKLKLWQRIIVNKIIRKSFVKLLLEVASFAGRTSRFTLYCRG